MIGKTVSHYRILEKLGEGGMGVVYKAEDLRLKRVVALKFLTAKALASEEDQTRFKHEAQAAAGLRHPGICTVYEIDEEDGQAFIVMEYIEGRSLKHRIQSGKLSLDEAVGLAGQIVDALREAHENNIVHRDIKPANILITPKGQAVITDFGLAKSKHSPQVTRTGTTIGTAAYMSPEQARGEDVDARTDVWSVGVMLYEMLTGQLPFKGEFEHAVIYSILNTEPAAPADINKDLPATLNDLILSTLVKDRDERCRSMADLGRALMPYGDTSVYTVFEGAASARRQRRIVRPALIVPAVVVVALIVFAGVRIAHRFERTTWARKVALPEIVRLVENDKYGEAFGLAREALEIIPADPILLDAWSELSSSVSINTDPPDAAVFEKTYDEPESEWEYVGRSPIEDHVIPKGFFRWKIEKDGYETVEAAGSSDAGDLMFELEVAGTIPEGMTLLKGGVKQAWVAALGRYTTIFVSDFLMDQFEVTNEQFKKFVDAGGYERPELWRHRFVYDGEVLQWGDAVARFVDATGRPGPATWELGGYADGEEKYPVTGVSWYEAAAYAAFAAKSLPTVHHWIYAASIRSSAHIIPLSNIGGRGLAPAGQYQGMSRYGVYDMAGNAREWCSNSSGAGYFILGGSWSDQPYQFHFYDVKRAFDRSPGNGFRCVKYFENDTTLAAAQRVIGIAPRRDYSRETPVADEVLDAYISMYSYDETPLNPQVELTDGSLPYWKIEKISFDAAYGSERMFAYLFLPRAGTPPYHTVVLFPGAYAMERRSSSNGNDLTSFDAVDFVIKSGRAVMYPIYKATFERRDGYSIYDPAVSMTGHRDHMIMWRKDLSRAIDYLETRSDIDLDNLCYYGSSQGAWIAPVLLAQEPRFKTAILRLGGLPLVEVHPSMDPFNYISRVKIPVLMMNGKYDYIFPYETSQVPMFQSFGAPPEHKRHVTFETAHGVFPHRNEMIRETLDWLDRYLGKVELD